MITQARSGGGGQKQQRADPIDRPYGCLEEATQPPRMPSPEDAAHAAGRGPPRSSDGVHLCKTRTFNLRFDDISVVIKNKTILKNVYGSAQPGEMLAIMGPSGSGKTTLLNILTGRKKSSSGVVVINNQIFCKGHRRKIGYVHQNDVLLTNLTTRQTVTYSAMLRLPEFLSMEQKAEAVNYVINLLDLEKCQNTKVGVAGHGGLSGGERKRTSIACELLTNPLLMCLDEPLSGLDSRSASNLASVLKSYATLNMTALLMTVHQPSAQIFQLFDKVLLLAKSGEVAFFGPTMKAVQLLCSSSHLQGVFCNPADVICEDIDRSLPRHYLHRPSQPQQRQENEDEEWSTCGGRKWNTGFWTQFKVLTSRNFRESFPKFLSRLNWIQTILLAFFAGALWFQLERKEERLMDLQGWIFFSTNYWMLFCLFSVLPVFPLERDVVENERSSGAYRLTAYYLAKMVGELPLTVALPFVYHFISYLMIGFRQVSDFFSTLGALLLNALVAQSVGLLIGASCMDIQVATTISALYTLATQLLAGHLVGEIPYWLSWTRYLSVVHYAYQNMQAIEFWQGIRCAEGPSRFRFCVSSNATNGTYSIVPYEDMADTLGLYLPVWANYLILVAFLLVFRFMGYFVLRSNRMPS